MKKLINISVVFLVLVSLGLVYQNHKLQKNAEELKILYIEMEKKMEKERSEKKFTLNELEAHYSRDFRVLRKNNTKKVQWLVKVVGNDVHVHHSIVETTKDFDPDRPVYFSGFDYRSPLRIAKREGEWWVMPGVVRKHVVLFQTKDDSTVFDHITLEVNYPKYEDFLGSVPGIVTVGEGPCIYAWM